VLDLLNPGGYTATIDAVGGQSKIRDGQGRNVLA